MRVTLIIQLLFIARAYSYVLNAPFERGVKRSTTSITTSQCQMPCATTCSPDCLPDCCVKSIQPSPPNAVPTVKSNAPLVAGAKPDMMITSVEEGETEECGEKGFNSPSDNSEDPPGTITIPLPPTMYVPPRPGEEPKELPLPDFKLPASILQGIPPTKSITLEPETIGSSAPVAVGNAPAAISPPVVASSASVPAATVVDLNKAASPPPSPPSTGIGLMYPKLPPVTVSEIPGRKPVVPLASKLPLVGGPLPPVKIGPVITSELPGTKPFSPLLPISVAPALPAALPPPLPIAKLPSHCEAESRDETNTATPPAAAPPVVPPVMNAPAASAPPAVPAAPVLSDGSVSSIPGVLEIAPSVVHLSANQECVHNSDVKPTYDVNVVKELHKELTSKAL